MIALYGAGQEFVNLINAGKLKKIDFVVDTNSQYYGGGYVVIRYMIKANYQT